MIINVTNQSATKNTNSINTEQQIFIIVNFTISITIITINIMVIWLHCWKKSKLPSNRILHSLSICDFLIGVGVMFITISKLFPVFDNPSTKFGLTCRILLDIYYTFLVETVVMHLCAITLDRYISLFYAFHYKSIVTKKSIQRFIFASWAIPLTTSSIQWFWLYKVIIGNPHDMKGVEDIEVWYSMVSFAIFLAFPLIILAVSFIAMLLEVRRIINCTPHHEKTLIKISAKQRRVILVYGLMYLTFVILAMPYFSLRFLIDVNNWMGKKENLNRTTVDITTTIRCFTSIANPIFYTSTSLELRSIAREVTKRLFCIKSFAERNHYSLKMKIAAKLENTPSNAVLKSTNL